MYHTVSLPGMYFFLGVLIIAFSSSVFGATCVPGDCAITYFNQSSLDSPKASAPYSVSFGYLYNNNEDSNSLFKFAISQINNDTSILPNVRLEEYSIMITTEVATTVASLAMKDLGVDALVVNMEDEFVVPSGVICNAFKIPQLSIRATDDAFEQKRDYPMLTRFFPTSASMTQGMVAVMASLNYSGALLFTTKDTNVAAAAITFTEQALKKGIRNIFSVSLEKYPSNSSVYEAVKKGLEYIDEYKLRPIVIITSTDTGKLLLAALAEMKVYGPDLLYIFDYGMSRSILSRAAPATAAPILNGAILFFPRDAIGDTYPNVSNKWLELNNTLFPAKKSPSSQWFVYDTAYAYAYALDLVLKSGKTMPQVTSADVLNAIYNVSFMGVSGQVSFDANRDYVAHNGYTIFNMYNISGYDFKPAALYLTTSDEIIPLLPFVYYNLSAIPPNPGYCKVCIHGTCSPASVCVCEPGWEGSFCSDKISKKDINDTIVWVLPSIAGAIIIIAVVAVVHFRKRREQLVKDLANRQRSEIPRNELKLLNRIGRGASGAVYKAVFRGTEVAVKSLLTGSNSSSVVEEFKMETAIMCALRHPNIVLFMGSCFDTAQREMLLVMEFCARGSLHDLLNDPKVTLQYELLLHLACQASQGMTFLHESSPPIIHRDLKSHNILLDDKFNAKISDFGLTRFKDANKKTLSNKPESLGTVFWSAPEVLSGHVHTEKSDCYSFGIVLWEMFHRSDPYPMMDLVTVAIDVMNKGIRPIMNPSTPTEMQDLIRDCWQQDPAARPDFQTITTRLRALSMQHPMYSFATGHQSRVEAPSGEVVMVNTKIISLFTLFDKIPKATKQAYTMHNHLLRSNLELYGGYEMMKLKDGFQFVFPTFTSALNWCVATQVSLMNLKWPEELLQDPLANVVSVGDVVVYCGLRVRMSALVGTPTTSTDSSTDRVTYSGPIVEKSRKLLKNTTTGWILVDQRLYEEVSRKTLNLVEGVTAALSSEISQEGDSLYEILPNSLSQRGTYGAKHPSYVVSMDEDVEETTISFSIPSSSYHAPSWLIPYKRLTIKQSIGKGQVGDYSVARWGDKEVAVKVLVNQKLREEDLIGLIADCSTLSKVKHPNLLPVHGVCLKPGYIMIVVDYIPNGSLRDLLSKDTDFPFTRLISVAHDIAIGMNYLTTHEIAELNIHDNFKSNNILVTSNWEVKITDFGQTNIKDLARTMTSISSVAWTAPEILNGESITTKCSVYSFGIILWEMYTRQVPYEGEHPLKVVSKILSGYRPPLPAECPQALKMLIQACLHENPDERPTWTIIVSELSYMRG